MKGMHKKIAVAVSGTVLAVGFAIAAPLVSQAAPANSPAPQPASQQPAAAADKAADKGEVGVLGGCKPDEYWACGRVANHSSIDVVYTTDWGHPDAHRHIVKPGHSAGGYGVDVDGVYVGKCGLWTEWGYWPAHSGWHKITDYQGLDIWGSWC